MKKRNGFTLIELLAVIIILAVIALIATPIVLNVVDNAKLKSLENSAYGVMDAAKLKYIESMMNDTQTKTGQCADLVVSGEKATAGTWTVTTDATGGSTAGVSITGVKFDSMKDYTCASKADGKVECTK